MDADIRAFIDEANRAQTVQAGSVIIMNGFADKLAAAVAAASSLSSADRAEINAEIAEMRAANDASAAAIAANTAAADEPPVG